MEHTDFVVIDILDVNDEEDTVRTIEQAAENVKQSIITQYYAQNSTELSPVNHDRIVITAGITTTD